MAWESRAESSKSPAALLLSSQARSFPHCTEWRKKAGFPPFGETPRTTAARNTTASPSPDGSNSKPRPSDAAAFPGLSPKLWKHRRKVLSMPLYLKVRSFLGNLFSPRRVDADLDQEVHAHLELLIAENIRAGMPPAEARRAARIELGGIEQVKEQVREGRLGNWLHSVLSDCRYGLRQLRNNPGSTAVMVFTLALAIGATTATLSVVYGVLLRPR